MSSFQPPALTAKRGDTFALACSVPGDLTTWLIRAQIRSPKDRLLAECDVSGALYDSLTDTTSYAITATAETTAAWPTVLAYMDIEYTDPAGVVQSTETIVLEIVRDITRPVVT